MSNKKKGEDKVDWKLWVRELFAFLLELFDGILRPFLAASVLLMLVFAGFMGAGRYLNTEESGKFFSSDNVPALVCFFFATVVGFVTVVVVVIFSVKVYQQLVRKQERPRRGQSPAPIEDASGYNVLQSVMIVSMLLALVSHIVGRVPAVDQNPVAVLFLAIGGVSMLLQLAQICDDNKQWFAGWFLAALICIATADCVTSFDAEFYFRKFGVDFGVHLVGLVVGALAILFRYLWMSFKPPERRLFPIQQPAEMAAMIALYICALLLAQYLNRPILWSLDIPVRLWGNG